MNHKEYLEEKLNKLPLPVKVNETQLEQFLQFYEMLVEKNKVMNLTGITEFSDVVEEEQKDAEHGIQILNGKIEKVDKFQIVGTDLDRSLVWIRKEGKLKGKYPRKAGTPSREPLH